MEDGDRRMSSHKEIYVKIDIYWTVAAPIQTKPKALLGRLEYLKSEVLSVSSMAPSPPQPQPGSPSPNNNDNLLCTTTILVEI